MSGENKKKFSSRNVPSLNIQTDAFLCRNDTRKSDPIYYERLTFFLEARPNELLLAERVFFMEICSGFSKLWIFNNLVMLERKMSFTEQNNVMHVLNQNMKPKT